MQAHGCRRMTEGKAPRRARGGTLLGVLIGFALGVAVAGVIAFFFTKTPNPFEGKSVRGDVASPHLSSVERELAKQGERPRFDFSKILPGTEERRVPKEESAPAPAGDKSTPAAQASAQPPDKGGKFFLQAGAYQNVADAEDQRAKLALMGIEASMQSVTLPDKGTLNRVRLGPYSSADEMNQVKADLTKRGIATAVIRNP